MLLKKQGFPEERDVVICTVTKIQPHGVFARIDEYENKSGMIHISEISPGRIRNIRDYVKEGKVIICTVLRINRERGYIDLSLRRVSEIQKRNKVNDIKQQQKSEKIIEHVAKDVKQDVIKVFKEVSAIVLKDYDALFHCFEDVSADECSLKEMGVSSDYVDKLEELIKLRIKPPEVLISGKIKVSSYADVGIEIIKKGLQQADDLGGEVTTIKYLGAGTYLLSIKGEEYKSIEVILDKILKALESYFKDNNSSFEFQRDEN